MDDEIDKKNMFEIKKVNFIGYWTWDIFSDTCAICRTSLQKPSINFISNSKSLVNQEDYEKNNDQNHEFGIIDHEQEVLDKSDKGLKIAIGFCNHVYHLDCIEKWLPTRNVCPLCNKKWECTEIKSICD